MSKLFIPGPVSIAPEVLAAQARPMLPYPGLEYEELFRRITERSRRIFLTENIVMPLALSQPGAQEVMLRNFVSHKLLCCVNGSVSQQWADIAAALGLETILLESEWGEPVFPNEFRQALEQTPVEAILLVHVEPSTGVISPLTELAQIAHEVRPDALLIVDASSSLGGIAFSSDELGLDVVFAESCQCLALPPGLTLASVSARAFERAAANPQRGTAFDLTRFDKLHRPGAFLGIPPLSLLYALDTQLDRMMLEGLDNRYQRHTDQSAFLQRWLNNAGFPLIAIDGYQSDTVLVFRNAFGWNFPDLDQYLLQRGLRIANGAGMFKDRCFRIAVMGETTQSDCEALTLALSEYKG